MAYTSLIQDTDIVQGDSSNIYKFGESTGSVLDVEWEASFTIKETADSDAIVERDLPKDVDLLNFVFQILPYESALLESGKKYLVGVEIRNTNINFNAEVAQYKLKVLPQLV